MRNPVMYYTLDCNNNVIPSDAEGLSDLYSVDNRTVVGVIQYGPITIRTMFAGFNTSHIHDSIPLTFVTSVFYKGNNVYRARNLTWLEARARYEKTCRVYLPKHVIVFLWVWRPIITLTIKFTNYLERLYVRNFSRK